MREPPPVAEHFLAAVCTPDFRALARCLDPSVRLRGLFPGDAVVQVGSRAVADRFNVWIGGWGSIGVLRSQAWTVGDRLAIAYRLSLRDGRDAAIEIEHQLYCEVAGDRILAIDLLGTGPARPAGR
ncbi:hypothetical protein Acy02nite_40370 [Actinoplanes cyaneus]|uniref:SnoaL-like domain-containing protein n=1 Tax=Actinoplanes cyaneus TaxID=52696 RepID=A0A919MCH7_9ACTN|nr:hypothetical protein [Actinoplanes cyaneus]MCW2139624.1 hypothetical protein [Actinoplanes cyaneus]GID66156.1 hypothetical protein Acy02nite_40370 [Actinoplanes cyaneus]